LRPELEKIIRRISQVILGKRQQIILALTCLFARGHLLIEDIPGVGKTTLGKVLAHCLGLQFRRIQFTSDLLPGDILGVSIYDQQANRFSFHAGPIFAHVLLVDEINRATPKTQSALLEAMEERQVTVEGNTHPLVEPFFVIATQNPLEHHGTFPLPESQLDRFLMRVSLGYPNQQAEQTLLSQGGSEQSLKLLDTDAGQLDVVQLQKAIDQVHASEAVINYVIALLAFSRQCGEFKMGLSPRAGLAILKAARAWSFFDQREFVLPEDVQAVLPWVIGHRLHAKESQRTFTLEQLHSLFQEVPVP
jgi:MoxR-like ATPase